jgi:sporulation protein YlmC with PRC-barrel domain
MKILPSGLTYKIKETSMIRALITSTFIGALATVPLSANAANVDAGASNGAAVGAAGTTTDVKPKVGMDATTTAPAAATTAPATDMSGMAATDTMVASNVIGADVKDGTGESIGEIGDLVLSGKGQIESYVIDVGGFLGMGEKPVALQPTDIMITADANGTLQIKTAMTKEQLKAMPDYKAPSEKENKG